METIHKREAWNNGKLVGQKPPLKPKDIWAIIGGNLEVKFERVLEKNIYNIWLIGPAKMVFSGTIEIV